MEQVSGAMTNLVYRCSSGAARAHGTVIVRVFGTSGKLFSQRDERNIFLLASDLGVGPKCLVGGGGWCGARGKEQQQGSPAKHLHARWWLVFLAAHNTAAAAGCRRRAAGGV